MIARAIDILGLVALLLIAAFPRAAWPSTPIPAACDLRRMVPHLPPGYVCAPGPHGILCWRPGIDVPLTDATPCPSPTPHEICIGDAFDADLGPIACATMKP